MCSTAVKWMTNGAFHLLQETHSPSLAELDSVLFFCVWNILLLLLLFMSLVADCYRFQSKAMSSVYEWMTPIKTYQITAIK